MVRNPSYYCKLSLVHYQESRFNNLDTTISYDLIPMLIALPKHVLKYRSINYMGSS